MTLELYGDHNQSIYRFAGARPELILEDLEVLLPDVQSFGLTMNFRSTAAIVNLGEEIIKYSYQKHGGELLDRFANEVTPFEENGEGVKVVYDVYSDATDEAWGVVNEIKALKESGEYEYDAHVIMARTRNQLGIMEAALITEDLPFLNLAGSSFWSMGHIQTIVQYLRLHFDKTNKDAMNYVCSRASEKMLDKNNKPSSSRFLKKGFANRFYDYDDVANTFHELDGRYITDDDKIKYSEMNGVRDFINTMDTIESEIAQRGFVQAAQWIGKSVVMHGISIIEGDAGNEDKKRDDLETVFGVMERAESLEEFLGFIDKALEAQKKVADKDWDGRILLSTIHGFKGLQRLVAHILGLSEGMMKDKATGILVPVGLLPHTYSLRAPESEGVLSFSFQSPLVDERRLFYVAITRAQERLYISTPLSYNGMTMGHSRFISEISNFLIA